MKLLTLNTHSLLESHYKEKTEVFVNFVLHEQPDIIALQEVNQSVSAADTGDAQCIGFLPAPESTVSLKLDNHALHIVRQLKLAGVSCSWTYLPVKLGYGQYDEGLAILSLCGRITASDAFAVSRIRDYRDWRVRKALGVRIENHPEWFYTVHMGWWDDKNEPFQSQWETLNRRLLPLRLTNRIWLMGDFNAPAGLHGQGYDLITASGWHDAYHLAGQKDDGITVPGAIDGWKESIPCPEGMRIDHIWCSASAPVLSSRVVFSGVREPVISDHFGILIETGGKQ